MIPWIKRRKTLSTITANFHNSTRHQETITGTRVPEPPIIFCKSKNDVNTMCVYSETLQNATKRQYPIVPAFKIEIFENRNQRPAAMPHNKGLIAVESS